ncbi:glycosyltransferase [Belnapia sp. T6]|uniref:Glycosyltransferase n=1 Tax=Belnapia mucosa TaxID=2804532 RepID=A0ABS1UXZ9_9PROT|nr:glycosyltransferase [Belnapia mucosa]MBL6453862.1 glycosyltransferase [Belnapia mucosa]
MDMISWSGAPGSVEEPAECLARADGLRDRRAWAEAARAYAAYLRMQPEAWAIRVQYGHCLKEDGDPEAALQAYREADRQNPGDADIHLQLGHALKLLNRYEEALEEYVQALTLDPANAAARQEVMALDPGLEDAPRQAPQPVAPPVLSPPPAAPQAAGTATVFDVSDLLDYFRHNRAPTGIQRVQLNIIREALAGPESGSIAIAGFDPEAGVWKRVPPEIFLRLATLSREGSSNAEARWRGAVNAVQEVLRGGPPLDFTPGSNLVNLGTSWWLPDYLRAVRAAKARHGLRYIPFIHDCIPLLVPEHCAPGLVNEFARWFASVCLHADAVLANSECTRADMLRAQRRLLPGLDLPCFTLPLDAADPASPASALPARLRGGRPYVLFVGTIESRKNHLLAFNAWLSLLRRHGPDAVPDLICVGKRGWLAEAALQLHQNSPALRARVHLLHGIPDIELEALYRHCLFTLYNSFYEGWGLPVTESLAAGKVPLVPDHSSLREAGREGAVYFTPQSEPDLVEKLERLIFDAGFRRAQEAVVAAGPRPRRWADLAAQLQSVLREASGSLPAPRERIAFRLGEVHELRLLPGPEPSLRMAIADALREGEGWHRLEEWGVWTGPGACRLQLPLEPGASSGRLRLYLEMVAPPEPVECRIRAGLAGEAMGAAQIVSATSGERLFCILDLDGAEAGEVEVQIETVQAATLPDEGGARQVGLGLRSLMLCRRDDIATRLDYLERAALPRMVGGG